MDHIKAALLILAASALITAIRLPRHRRYMEAVQQDAEEEAAEDHPQEPDEAAVPETETCRAEILEARREMDPVTLQGWSRVTFLCEDGETRKMTFPGENGIYLLKGEKGMLEHREGAFVSFEKDTGEIVGALYHIPADEMEE